jgi:hypothetical protein
VSGAGKGGVLFEFVTQGNAVKAVAIDPSSGTEACIVGPAAAGRDALARAAARKLKYVMERKS